VPFQLVGFDQFGKCGMSITAWREKSPSQERRVWSERRQTVCMRAGLTRFLSGLSADCRRCVAGAAVLGHEFTLDVLARTLDPKPTHSQLVELLDEAERAEIVVPLGNASYGFRFADQEVWESIYAGITIGKRVRLHAAAARALTELYGPALEPHFAQLADHFAQTGQPEDAVRAVEYGVKAADRFSALHQYQDAIQSYQLALSVLLRSAPDPTRHGNLLLGLGSAQRRAGRKLDARRTLEEAAQLVKKLRAPELLARVALEYGEARSWGDIGVVNHTLLPLLNESLKRLPKNEHGLRARVQGRLAAELYHVPPHERRAPLRAALSEAHRSRDPATVAHARLSRRFALWLPDNAEQRRDDASAAVTLATEAEDLELTAEAVSWLIGDLLELGLVREADLQIQALAKLSEQLKQPVFKWRERCARSMRAAMHGRFEDAETLANEALQIGIQLQDGDASLVFAAQMFAIRRLQGRLGEIEEVARGFADGMQNVWVWRVGLAAIASAVGNETDARHEFEYLARNDFSDLFRDMHWLTAVALLADVCASLKDVSRASILYELLAPFSSRHITEVAGIGSVGCTSYYLGVLASTMGHWSTAIEHFEAALKMHREMQAVPYVAQTEHALAAALLARNQSTDAQRANKLLDSAIATYERLGMPGYLAEAQALRQGKSRTFLALGDSRATESSPPLFVRDGGKWNVTWRSETVSLNHVRGLSVIAHLVRHSGERFHLTELAAVADGVVYSSQATAPSRLSAQQQRSSTWQSLWREVRTLEWEIRNAQRRGDRSEVRAFRRKVALIRKRLERDNAPDLEKVRKRIGRNLSTASQVIGLMSGDLRRHLACAIDPKFKEISYKPDAVDQQGGPAGGRM
jgi:tetratricopeptide (TPR) repeat protein